MTRSSLMSLGCSSEALVAAMQVIVKLVAVTWQSRSASRAQLVK